MTGSTKEIVEAVGKAKAVGARVFGFVDRADALIAAGCDWCVFYPANEQLKFYMVANRMMYNCGEFADYDRYNCEMEAHLAKALVEVGKQADGWAAEFAAAKHACVQAHPNGKGILPSAGYPPLLQTV